MSREGFPALPIFSWISTSSSPASSSSASDGSSSASSARLAAFRSTARTKAVHRPEEEHGDVHAPHVLEGAPQQGREGGKAGEEVGAARWGRLRALGGASADPPLS